MANRYVVMGQIFIEDVDASIDTTGRKVADTAFTTPGAGSFKVHMANGCTGTVTGTNVTGTPVTLAAGENTIVCSGAVADGNIDITIGTAANTNTINSWSAASGGKCGASVPTSSDACFADSNSFTAGSQVLTVNAIFSDLSMDWTGATNSPTFASASYNFRIYGTTLTWIAAMTITGFSGGANGILVYGSLVLTSNGNTNAGYFVLQTTGNLQLADTYAGGGGFSHQYGTLDFNGQTVTADALYESYTNARTLTLGAATVNIGTNGFDYSGSNLTVTANTSTFNITSTGPFNGGNITTWNNINLNGTAHTVNGSFTCAVITRNGTATKTDSVTFTAGITITCTTFAMIGNSATNRLLVQSSTRGTAFTVTATNWTGSSAVDIMDCTATNAVDLSVALTSGDCGGNTGITFTVAAAQTWDGTTGNWSASAKWTSRVPLPQDDVTVGGANTVTLDMPRAGKNITGADTATITPTISHSIFGSLTLIAGNTWTTGTVTTTFAGRAAFTFNSGAETFYNVTVSAPSGTLTLAAALAISNSYSQTIGTFVDGGYTITLSATTAITKWSVTGGTVTATGTIVLTNSGTNAQTFAGGGKTYYNVTVQGAGVYALTITSNNTYTTFTVDRSAAAKTITATGTTQTVTNFICATATTTTVTLNGGTWTKAAGGQISLDYIITAGTLIFTPANTWFLGEHSYISSGTVSGAIFGSLGGSKRSIMVPMLGF